MKFFRKLGIECLNFVRLNLHLAVKLKPMSPTLEPKESEAKEAEGLVERLSFLVFSNEGSVFTQKLFQTLPNRRCKPSSEGKWTPNSIIHTDGWRGYDGLVDIGVDKNFRVNHGNNEFVRGSKHVNGIESFWSFAKHRLVKFNGVKKSKFELHLKETEFRFNHRHENLYLALLKLLRENPL